MCKNETRVKIEVFRMWMQDDGDFMDFVDQYVREMNAVADRESLNSHQAPEHVQ